MPISQLFGMPKSDIKTLQEHFEFHTYNVAEAFVIVGTAIDMAPGKYNALHAHLEELIEKYKIEYMGEICSAHEQIEMRNLTEAEITAEADKLLEGFLNPSKKDVWD